MFYALAFVNFLTTGDFKGPYKSIDEAKLAVKDDIPDIGDKAGWWIVNKDLWSEMGGETGYVDDSMELDDQYVEAVVPEGMVHVTEESEDGE